MIAYKKCLQHGKLHYPFQNNQFSCNTTDVSNSASYIHDTRTNHTQPALEKSQRRRKRKQHRSSNLFLQTHYSHAIRVRIPIYTYISNALSSRARCDRAFNQISARELRVFSRARNRQNRISQRSTRAHPIFLSFSLSFRFIYKSFLAAESATGY